MNYFLVTTAINDNKTFHEDVFMLEDDGSVFFFEYYSKWQYVEVQNDTFQGGQIKDADGECLTRMGEQVVMQVCAETATKLQTWIVENSTDGQFIIRPTCTIESLYKYINEETLQHQAQEDYNSQHYEIKLEALGDEVSAH